MQKGLIPVSVKKKSIASIRSFYKGWKERGKFTGMDKKGKKQLGAGQEKVTALPFLLTRRVEGIYTPCSPRDILFTRIGLPSGSPE